MPLSRASVFVVSNRGQPNVFNGADVTFSALCLRDKG
jgi:hypothetical protein